MKLSRISFSFLLLFLFIPSLTYAQSAAERAWKPFWAKFSVAVIKKDRATLKTLMANQVEFGIEDYFTPSGVIKRLDNENYWTQLKKSVGNGVKSCGYDAPDCNRTTNPARRTKKPMWCLFEYTGGQWRWTAILGD